MILTKFIFYSTAWEEECPWHLSREDFPFEISDEDWKLWNENKWSSKSKLPKLFEQYCNDHNFHQVDREVTYYDLSKRYETIEVVFSFEGKYYKYEYYDWDDGNECEDIDTDLKEVFPHTSTIEVTKYY